MAVTDWEAGVDEVGARLRVRTRYQGTELGTFTPDTRPTDTEVRTVIQQAADTVSARIGTDIPAKYWARARAVVALRSAMEVELQYFGDQVSANRSPYPQLKALYDEDIAALVKAVGESGGEEPEDANLRPQGGFSGLPATGIFGSPVAPYGPEGYGPYGVGGAYGTAGGNIPAEYLPW